MYIRLSATWLEDKEKHENLITLSQTILIEDLRKIVQEKTGVDPEHQRLFYKGKELTDGQILNDYSIAPNDIVLLAKRNIPVEDPQDNTSILTEDSIQEEEEDDKSIPAESKYYSIGDYVDTRVSESDSWVEARILGIFKKQEEVVEQDLIFKVQSADHVSNIPYEDFVSFEDIRPASYYTYTISELKPGMTVLANYNFDSPKDRGNWLQLVFSSRIILKRCLHCCIFGHETNTVLFVISKMDVSNIYDLMRIIFLEDEQLLNLLQSCSLVRRNFRCSVNRCRRYCNLRKRENCALGFIFCCPSCKKKYSIFKGSFFEKSKIPVRDVLLLLWEWSCQASIGVATSSSRDRKLYQVCRRVLVSAFFSADPDAINGGWDENSRLPWKQLLISYDFHITKVGSIDIVGTVVKGSGSVENCNIKFIQEFMRIEQPKLLGDQLRSDVVEIHKRKYPYDCKICKDDIAKKCKICSCSICGSKDNWGQILLCDDCNKGFHIYCSDPPMETVPDGDWYCSSCKTDTSEIVQPGEKLKVTKKKQNMNTSKKNWGNGMACVGVSERNDIVPKDHVGAIPGIKVGTCWKFRQGVASAGVHRPMVAGIHGQKTHCAYSVVLSGGYEDDDDYGNEFYYTGAGGRDLSGNLRTGKQCFDQELVRTNKALALNCYATFNSEKGAEAADWKKGKAVRVVRSYKLGEHSQYAPKEGYRYDGIYKVVKYFQQKGKAGHMVWKYLLRRDDPAPAPWEDGGQTFDIIYPDNYLESQAEKKRMKEEEMRIKEELQNQKPGTSQKKRKRASDSTDLDVTTKKPKNIPYKLELNVLKAINDDAVNHQLWVECRNAAKEGQKKFIDKVKEVFICIICRSLVYDPLTLRCSLNICLNCLKDSLSHCDTEDFHCPHCREILGKTDTFIKEIQEFKNDKLRTALDMLFPGYGKT